MTSEELVEQYQGIAHGEAWGLFSRMPNHLAGAEFEDLKQEALIALLSAPEHYDPTRGLSFEVFTRWHIRHRLGDYLRKIDHLTRYRRDRLGDQEDSQRWAAPLTVDFADEVWGNAGVLSYQEDGFDAVNDDEVLRAFREWLGAQPFRTGAYLAVVDVWMEGVSQREVAARAGVHETRVSQILSDLLKRAGAWGQAQAA
jgi:RNA polymerase sigma factor (sigma-70 family)